MLICAHGILCIVLTDVHTLVILIVFLVLCLRAVELKCLNADMPDKYGHYREAKFSQIKHHWFWKVSTLIICLSVIVTAAVIMIVASC